jgi:hypothetical protein
MLLLLDAAHTGKVAVEDLLAETIRLLLVIRNERDARMASLMAGLQHQAETPPLSSEEIVTLIEQHLRNKKSARLPVLVVAAAYRAVGKRIGERVLPLQSHTAADEQTGTLGDLEVCLENDQQIVTAYEMKMKKVTIDDLDRALQKIALFKDKLAKAEPVKARLHNYIFITTDLIPADVQRYAAELYSQTGGTEIAILDCIGFLRHFLHFFHRARLNFVDVYQELVLAEPESGVSQPLKEAFLALRQAAESDE